MILRCRVCKSSVEVPDNDSGEGWRMPMWDHLIDEHYDQVVLGKESSVEFTGPGGIQGIRVSERGKGGQ